MEKEINPKDYTVVTACRNREKNLKISINSWAKIDPYQIIIVDWGSDIHIQLDHFNPSIRHLIKIIRFEESQWILTWAFNEGLSKVKTKYTIKVDCDHQISESILINSKCNYFRLIRGSHRYGIEGQQYTNGAFICCSELLKKVGYFDERITTYGWDDSDLYLRLSDYMKSFSLFQDGDIWHLPQDQTERVKHQSIKKEDLLAKNINYPVDAFCIERNQFMMKILPRSWGEWMFEARYEIRKEVVESDLFKELASFFFFYQVKKEYLFRNGKTHDLNKIVDEFFQILYKDFKEDYTPICLLIPEIIDKYKIALETNDSSFSQIIKYIIFNLYKEIDSKQNYLLKIENIILNEKKSKSYEKSKRIIVRPMHGLGNRLRVIASAYNIARKSKKDLVICWDKDEHLNAEFHDLFVKQRFDINVDFVSSKFLENIHEMSFYQYMENEPFTHKHEEINTDTDLDIVITSSCVINSKFNDFKEENNFLKSLLLREEINEIVNQIKITDNHIGVHIRYDGDNWENLAPEDVKNWNSEAHEILRKNRNNSKPDRFAKRMRELINNKNEIKFFVSAAKFSSIEFLLSEFKNKIEFIDRPKQADNRDSESIKYALVDMLLLSKCKYILGSGWSSFTEGAQRFSNYNQIIEIAGENF